MFKETGVMSLMKEGDLVDFDVLNLAETAKGDEDYRKLVDAPLSGIYIKDTTLEHPLREYGKVKDKLSMSDLPGGVYCDVRGGHF